MVKIGIFDSGIGGLSILKEIQKLNKALDIYYIADSAHNPYGNLTAEQIRTRCEIISKRFIDLGCEQIVFACNTATAVAIDDLRSLYPTINFIGVEPYINVINHRTELRGLKGMILVTPQTMKSKRFADLKLRLDPNNVLEVYAPPKLAGIIENGFFKGIATSELEAELKIFKGQYDFFILGCTHYPLVVNELKNILDAQMISPCPMISKRLESFITEAPIGNVVTFHYLNTRDGDDFVIKELEEIFSHMK